MLEEHDECDYAEHGPPPYCATTIASQIGGSVQSVARTLRGMAQAGSLISVKDRQQVRNAIAQGDIETTVTAYYSTRTMDRDIAAAKVWRDGAAERSLLALEKMMPLRAR
jgi:hypothetical protein